MSKTAKRKKPGPVKRDRTALVLRITPDLADWYTAAAQRNGQRSRTQLIEQWLQVLPDVLRAGEEEFRRDSGWHGAAVKGIGIDIVAKLVALGWADEWLRDAWRLWRQEQERRQAEFERERAEERREGQHRGT